MNKNIYIYSIIAVVVVGAVIFGMSRNNKTNNVADTSVSVSPSPSQSPTSPSTGSGQATLTPKLTKSTPKPSPKLIAKEVNQYQSLVDLLEPLNRRLTLDRDCISIVPSQVVYPNNTQIMIDNTFSPKAHIIKIGSQEYSLTANGWLLVTLNSTTLPAQLTMFCGPMELGQLDLE